ncbi:MAG: hypothetical protein ABJA98_18430 [Acidobacteriota bacterium]
MRTINDLLARLRAEFVATPRLLLTVEQVQQLCAIEQRVCQLMLKSLVDARFLSEKPDGAYGRFTCEVGSPEAAKRLPRTADRGHRRRVEGPARR